MRILIVDDDRDLLEQLQIVLTNQKYEVKTVADGEAALDELFDRTYDLVLLDIMLPERDGLSVLKEVRQSGISTPVLMLTARGAVEDKVIGLDYGADDYLAKPFSMAELLARVRSLLRRVGDNRDQILRAKQIAVDAKSRQVSCEGRTVDLTPKEFSILEFLLYNKNRVVSRYTLAEHVWGDEFDPFTMSNFIDVHVKNLRRKLADTGGRTIQTVRGVGYIIEDAAQ